MARVYLRNLSSIENNAATHGEVMRLLHNQVGKQKGRAHLELGKIYERGTLKSVAINANRAYAHYQAAAKLGNWRGHYAIARMYDKGNLIERDRILAGKIYEILIREYNYEPAKRALAKLKEE